VPPDSGRSHRLVGCQAAHRAVVRPADAREQGRVGRPGEREACQPLGGPVRVVVREVCVREVPAEEGQGGGQRRDREARAARAGAAQVLRPEELRSRARPAGMTKLQNSRRGRGRVAALGSTPAQPRAHSLGARVEIDTHASMFQPALLLEDGP